MSTSIIKILALSITLNLIYFQAEVNAMGFDVTNSRYLNSVTIKGTVIKVGMSKEEVTGKWGKPSGVSKSDPNLLEDKKFGSTELWWYPDEKEPQNSQKGYRLHFKQDELVGIVKFDIRK